MEGSGRRPRRCSGDTGLASRMCFTIDVVVGSVNVGIDSDVGGSRHWKGAAMAGGTGSSSRRLRCLVAEAGGDSGGARRGLGASGSGQSGLTGRSSGLRLRSASTAPEIAACVSARQLARLYAVGGSMRLGLCSFLFLSEMWDTVFRWGSKFVSGSDTRINIYGVTLNNGNGLVTRIHTHGSGRG
ncbi:putative protein transport protein SEC31 [Iris pallida]|uniref:Uncharacterized protein n=1 Tax=Iris pallida TaxID=29817 RepID=A0AAX6FQT1_IRIPA|nr:putative protein transport protein SEC31 [Iris pallida]